MEIVPWREPPSYIVDPIAFTAYESIPRSVLPVGFPEVPIACPDMRVQVYNDAPLINDLAGYTPSISFCSMLPPPLPLWAAPDHPMWARRLDELRDRYPRRYFMTREDEEAPYSCDCRDEFYTYYDWQLDREFGHWRLHRALARLRWGIQIEKWDRRRQKPWFRIWRDAGEERALRPGGRLAVAAEREFRAASGS